MPLKNKKEILKEIDNKLKEYYIMKVIKWDANNMSEAQINDNYFFALFYLKEKILGEDLSYHEEINRIRLEIQNEHDIS